MGHALNMCVPFLTAQTHPGTARVSLGNCSFANAPILLSLTFPDWSLRGGPEGDALKARAGNPSARPPDLPSPGRIREHSAPESDRENRSSSPMAAMQPIPVQDSYGAQPGCRPSGPFRP
jgi:hypothetical protein